MMYQSAVLKGYSILNNYIYEGKSSLASSIDWLSTPLRTVLGGRDVNISETASSPASMLHRITTLVLSVLFFPVIVVSATSLALKSCTSSWEGEQQKIIELELQDLFKDLAFEIREH